MTLALKLHLPTTHMIGVLNLCFISQINKKSKAWERCFYSHITSESENDN